MKVQSPLIDFLLYRQEAQSESAKPFNTAMDDDPKNKPCPTIPLIHWST